MIRNLILIAIALSLISCEYLSNNDDIEVVILKSGIIEVLDYGHDEYNATAITGINSVDVDMRISKEANVIPMIKGISFGVEWCIKNLKDGEFETITEYLYTPFDVNKHKARVMSSVNLTGHSLQGISCTIDAYELTEEIELLPGHWEIRSIYNRKVIMSKIFVVKSDADKAIHPTSG